MCICKNAYFNENQLNTIWPGGGGYKTDNNKAIKVVTC